MQAFSNEDVIGYINEHYVPVEIKDSQADPMAPKLGITMHGYPTIVVYGPGEELIGTVGGFGGKDSWFAQLKEVQSVGDKLVELKSAAEKDPAKWLDVAEMVSKIPGRADDALAILDRVPEKVKASEAYKTAKAGLEADVAWVEVHQKVLDLMQGVRSREQALEKAPDILAALDGYLGKYEDTGAQQVAAALAAKGFFLFLKDDRGEASKIARILLEKYPDSDAVERMLGSLPWH